MSDAAFRLCPTLFAHFARGWGCLTFVSTHDDFSRIASVNCGSIWSQSFGFDPFGNISKTGSLSFQPTYTTSTNQIATIPGAPNPTYDANGNLKTITDGTNHTYTWDAEGKQLGIDSSSATYDALGKMVELNVSGTYTETLYGLGSEKLALMSGQILQKAFVATPSGTAVFTASGLSFYRHSDWLGSSRFASTTSRTMYSSSAYAPFGEQYAKAGTNDQDFTGQQPDSASGLYDFLFRRLSQTQGRWISPDPAGIGAVDVSNPQSWNRYAYVANRALIGVDRTGLDVDFDFCPAEFQSCTFWDGSSAGFAGDFGVSSGESGNGQSGCYIDGIATNCNYAANMILYGVGTEAPTGPEWKEFKGTDIENAHPELAALGCWTNIFSDLNWCPLWGGTIFFKTYGGIKPIGASAVELDPIYIPGPKPTDSISAIKPTKIDWNKLTNECVSTYGFSNPGRPPSGVNASGIESIVVQGETVTLVDQYGRNVKSFTLNTTGGAAGSGGSGGLGLLLLFDPVTECIANLSAWRSALGD